MFLGLCLWATVVVQSMTSIPGQSGWFKTKPPAPPIVSCAQDFKCSNEYTLTAESIACTYALTLANYKYNDDCVLLMQNGQTESFDVGKVHQQRGSGGEDGVIVHNAHKQTGISYITFLVGDWNSLQGRLDEILLQYHKQYQLSYGSVLDQSGKSKQDLRNHAFPIGKPADSSSDNKRSDPSVYDWNVFATKFKNASPSGSSLTEQDYRDAAQQPNFIQQIEQLVAGVKENNLDFLINEAEKVQNAASAEHVAFLRSYSKTEYPEDLKRCLMIQGFLIKLEDLKSKKTERDSPEPKLFFKLLPYKGDNKFELTQWENSLINMSQDLAEQGLLIEKEVYRFSQEEREGCLSNIYSYYSIDEIMQKLLQQMLKYPEWESRKKEIDEKNEQYHYHLEKSRKTRENLNTARDKLKARKIKLQ